MKRMSKSTRKKVVLDGGATSDTTRDRFRDRYQCYSNNPDVFRALLAHELPEKTDLAVRVHVWNCQRCRSEYSKLKAESIADAAASQELNLSSKDPVVETTQPNIEMEPQTAHLKDADFRKFLEQLLSGRQTREALLLNPVFQRRVPIICQSFARNAADAEELTNYVRLAVCDRLRQFKPNYQQPYGNFFRWVSRIARNKAINDFRHSSLRQGDCQLEETYAVQDDTVDEQAKAERHEVIERFWAFVGKRDPITQEIMRFYVEDNSFKEIVEKLTAEGFKMSHVAISIRIRNVMADFIASENARRAGTIARKGNYRSSKRKSMDRERGDSSSRKTGS